MKKLIKSTALLFVAALLTTSVFAADKTKTSDRPDNNTEVKNAVSFSAMTQGRGVNIAINNTDKALVTITDAQGNVLSKKSLSGQKAYILNQLEEGDYTIAVKQNNEVVTKAVHVYSDENYNKAIYFVM